MGDEKVYFVGDCIWVKFRRMGSIKIGIDFKVKGIIGKISLKNKRVRMV